MLLMLMGMGISVSERAVDKLEIGRNASLIPMGQASEEERVVKTK
jgi:hypothetical protein